MAPLSAYLLCSMAIFSSFVSADSSTVNLLNPGVGLEPLYASVAGSDATATTYEIQCVPTLPSSICLLPTTPFPFVEGPKTVSWVVAKNTGVHSGLTNTCTKEGTIQAVCVSFGEGVFGGLGTYTQSLQTGDIFGLTPVTVTAGLNILGSGSPSSPPASAAASVTGSTGAPTVSAGTSTTGSPATSGSQVTAATASSASVASSKASSGPAMPKATMNNGVLAAAAMAVALL